MDEESVSTDEVKLPGFWQGVLHGAIAPFTFIVSLFRPNVQMYHTPNKGAWYNFGFLLGMMILLGGNRGGAAMQRRKEE
jgi:hypothetical protein